MFRFAFLDQERLSHLKKQWKILPNILTYFLTSFFPTVVRDNWRIYEGAFG